MLLDL